MAKKITLPLTEELAKTLHAGDQVLLTGTIYTSRDAGHKRMCEALARGEKIPFDPTDATIYYVGPTPAKPGQVIGSAGPTTSGRMDAYAPTMMSVGARGMIGKGARLPEVVEAMKKYSGVYFGAIGGAGALLAKCIKKAELIAYEDLGAEALRKLYVEDMPLVVIIDSEGNNLYEEGRADYLKGKTTMDMEMITDLMEAVMILCFGLSWPISIRKSWVSRTAKGKSLFFECFIWIGYVFGIARKFMQLGMGVETSWLFYLAWFFYFLNIAEITIDILLYFRNVKLDKERDAKQA